MISTPPAKSRSRGITAERLASLVAAARGDSAVRYAPSLDEAIARLVAEARAGDLIVTLGAGSVSAAGPLLLEALAATA